MNKGKFIEYISDFSRLNHSSLEELKFLLDEFPYFQSAWILYAKNLNDLKDVRFDKKLKLATIYISDRKKLAKLLRSDSTKINDLKAINESDVINPESNIVSIEKIKVENISTYFEIDTSDNDNTFENISQDANTAKFEIIAKEEIIDSDNPIEAEASSLDNKEIINNPTSKINTDSSIIVESKKEESNVENKNTKSENNSKFDLIDKFLLSNPRIIPDKDYNSSNSSTNYSKALENEELFSETLAKIYVKQGHFEKAILTYEKLCLKYPEKNIYFASQIKKIEELIKNKKN